MVHQVQTVDVKDRMQSAVEQKLINFDDERYAPKTGVVNVVPIRTNKITKEINHTFSSFVDPTTGEWFGIPVRIGPDGKYVFKKIRMTGSREFNLRNPEERREFILLKYYPGTIGSPYLRGKPRFKIHDPLEEARRDIERHAKRKQAMEIADTLISGEDTNLLIGFARLFNITPGTDNIIVVKKLMLDKSEREPEQFLEKWENTTLRDVKIAIKRGIATALIKNQPGKGYVYQGVPIGSNEQNVESYFLENTDMLHQLDTESKTADPLYVKPGEKLPDGVEEPVEVPEATSPELTQVEGDGLMDQITNMKAQTEGATETPAEAAEEEATDDEVPEEAPVVVDQAELAKWRAKCQEKGYPESEWGQLGTVSDITEYITIKSTGIYDEQE